MTTPTYVWAMALAVFCYFVATDPKLAEFFNLVLLAVRVTLRKYYYLTIMHPYNPITNWIMARKMKKLAAKLCKEYGIPDED